MSKAPPSSPASRSASDRSSLKGRRRRHGSYPRPSFRCGRPGWRWCCNGATPSPSNRVISHNANSATGVRNCFSHFRIPSGSSRSGLNGAIMLPVRYRRCNPSKTDFQALLRKCNSIAPGCPSVMPGRRSGPLSTTSAGRPHGCPERVRYCPVQILRTGRGPGVPALCPLTLSSVRAGGRVSKGLS